MSRTHLLGAVSAAALACLSTSSFAQSSLAITGGGSTLAEFDYFAEFASFNASQSQTAAIFNNPAPATGNNALYWPAGSGSGQTAFLNDDLSCDANKVDGNNGKNCSGTVGGAASTDYGASDATLSSTQISGWASSPVGQAAAGNLIQLPSMGVGISFPVVNSKITKNGATAKHQPVAGGVTFTDADLCGIFSGKITDWSGTSAKAKLAAGPINVVYRSDGSGTSFLLLNHLAAVCTSTNSSFTLPIVPSTTFASVFPNSTPPANFTGESGSSGVASYLNNATGVVGAPTVTSAIGYLSPDFTTVDPNSDAVLANGAKSTLVVAAVKLGAGSYIPLVADVQLGLNHAKTGTTLTPPTNATDGANPVNYVPLIQTVSIGYPVVGYTTFDFAQCYHFPTVANALKNFLTRHYSKTNATYAGEIARNGFVSIAASGASAFAAVITNDILANKNGWKTDIQDAPACKGLAGR